ncbi:MAG TPA: dihydroorotate dehydrogenase [Thermoanaerobaculia bacterium]|nr:dihydroorotate dehydrogenase [Thermoanaerobaculia bacterium]
MAAGGEGSAVEPAAVDLSVRLGRVELANPLLTASGTFGYGLEFGHLAALPRLGGLVTKGLSLEPIPGNPPPRICETRGGMLNSIGLQNIGIESFVADVLPGLQDFDARVIVNLFGTSIEEYARLAARVDGEAGIAAVELNVSCPNVKRGGIQFGHDPRLLAELVAAVRAQTTKPIAVKLSPNVTSPTELGLAARDAGADILSAINTVVGMAIDSRTRRPLLHTVRGGLSGPAIKPIALRIVFDVARAVGLPVIGIGGIETVDDVLEFLLAGASAVQVGTALFRDPRTPERILDGLTQRLAAEGVSSVGELIGAVRLDPEDGAGV